MGQTDAAAMGESKSGLGELAREVLRLQYPKDREALLKLWLSGKPLPEHLEKKYGRHS